jgi:hypothetical protein
MQSSYKRFKNLIKRNLDDLEEVYVIVPTLTDEDIKRCLKSYNNLKNNHFIT